MQYERELGGVDHRAARRRTSTRAKGFDRMLAILNGVESVFATDLFAPLMEASARVLRRHLR